MTEGFYEQLGVGVDATTAEIRAAFAARVAQILKRRRAIADQGGDPTPLDLTRVQLDEAHTVLIDPARRRRYDALRAIAADGLPTGPEAEAELWRRAAGALVSPAAGAAAELVRVATNLKVGALSPVPRPPARDMERTAPIPGRARPIAPHAEVTSNTSSDRTGSASDRTGSASGRTGSARTTTASSRPTVTDKPAAARPSAADRPSGGDDRVVPLHAGATTAPRPSEPGLRVVDGTRTGSAPVVVMPTAAARPAPATDPGRPRTPPKTLSAEDLARLVDQQGWSGALFRSVREARGIPLQALSDTTRISSRYLEAIEAEAQDALPSTTFVRGYVREIARQLGLDEEAAVAGYVRRLKA